MKYCRFRFENQVMYGAVEERGGEPWIVDLAAAPEEDLAFHLAHARALAAKELVIDPAGFDFEPMPLGEAELLPPVTPSKIVCVGRNYRDHAKELGNEVPTEPYCSSSRRLRCCAQGRGADAAAVGAGGF